MGNSFWSNISLLKCATKLFEKCAWIENMTLDGAVCLDNAKLDIISQGLRITSIGQLTVGLVSLARQWVIVFFFCISCFEQCSLITKISKKSNDDKAFEMRKNTQSNFLKKKINLSNDILNLLRSGSIDRLVLPHDPTDWTKEILSETVFQLNRFFSDRKKVINILRLP